MRVYLDNAATTPISSTVIAAMTACMEDHYGNPSSIHGEGRSSRVVIENARKTIANELKASIGEIFFTSGGTESNNMALRCAVRDLGVRHIVTSKIEHHCISHAIEALDRDYDISVTYLSSNELGQIDLNELSTILQKIDVPVLVSIMHANNEIGTMIDLDQVSQVCSEHGAFFHTDSIQTVGHFPIDVSTTPVHFLSGSGHKFHGPKGSGFIYINNDIKINPMIEGGAQERNMRAGTENLYGICGLEVAFKEAYEEMEDRRRFITDLRTYLKKQLLENFEDIQFNGVQEEPFLYTVLNVSFPKTSKSDLLLMNLDIEGIAASGGSACSSGAELGSHVLQAIGADPSRKAIRFSFSHNNTRSDIDFLIDKLKKIIPVNKLEKV